MRLVMDVLCDADKVLFARLVEALRLMEDDSLGGGGSRGSGRVKLAGLRLLWRGKGFYSAGQPEKELCAGVDVAGLQAKASAPDFEETLS